jgi:hypothetical protein
MGKLRNDPGHPSNYKRKKTLTFSSHSLTVNQRVKNDIKRFGKPFPFVRPDGVVKLQPGETKYFAKTKLSDNSFIDDTRYTFIIKEQPNTAFLGVKTKSNGLLSVNGCPKGTITAFQISTQRCGPSLESAWKQFGWYCLSSWVLSVDEILMMINTPSNIDEKGNVEKFNAVFKKIIVRDDKGAETSIHYAITNRDVHANEYIMVQNYGHGVAAIPFGQKQVLQLQRNQQAIYKANKTWLSVKKPIAWYVCERCANAYHGKYLNRSRKTRGHICKNDIAFTGSRCHPNAKQYLENGMMDEIEVTPNYVNIV